VARNCIPRLILSEYQRECKIAKIYKNRGVHPLVVSIDFAVKRRMIPLDKSFVDDIEWNGVL